MSELLVAGLILAGGQSKRFGSDKASAPVLGRPMLAWVASGLAPACDQLVLVKAAGQRLPAVDFHGPVTEVVDAYPSQGPLAALATGLAATQAPLCFAASCDVPLVRPELVRLLAAFAVENDIVCPRVGGYLQPLVAVYRASACLPVFRDFVERGVLKTTDAFAPLRLRVVAEDEVRAADRELDSFVNANRPEMVPGVEARLRARVQPAWDHWESVSGSVDTPCCPPMIELRASLEP